MKIIVTDSFLKKYYKKISFIDFNKFILKLKTINLIILKQPYFKIKINI
jgi:hypothetical protein